MRKLALLTLLVAGLSQSAGCIIVSDDDTAQFHASWSLRDTQSNTLSCAEVYVTAVLIEATDSLGTTWRDVYNCTDMGGYTDPLPLDNYTVGTTASDCPDYEPADGACFNDPLHRLSAPNGMPAALDVAGEVVELTYEFLFDLAPTSGDIVFDVDYGATGGNCADTASSGAAVSAQYTYLEGGGVCVGYDLTFDNVQNKCGDTADQPCESCGDPAICAEKAVVQALLDVPNGTYTLYVQGSPFTGGGCYEGSASVTVNGADVDVGTINAPHNGESGLCSYKR